MRPTPFRLPILLIGGIVLAAAPVMAQQTYPLICNLPGTGLTLWADGFSMSFRGARAGYDARQPGPGECAWRDRGFRPDEPRRIQWRVEDRIIFGTLQLDAEGRVTGQIYAAGGGTAEYDLFNTVMAQWHEKGRIRFSAYRDGNVMKVTRVRRLR